MRILILVLVICTSTCAARGSGYKPEQYFALISKQLSDCSMHYETVTTFQGKTQQINGFMAISPNRYLDSNNVHFMLMNQEWIIMAEHTQKRIEVRFIPELLREVGDNSVLDIGEYLLNDDEFRQYSQYTVTDMQDSLIIKLAYQQKSSRIKELKLIVRKQGFVLMRYNGTLKYPAFETEDLDEMSGDEVTVTFNCHHISQAPAHSLFDASRIISKSGDKAFLKRFQNYKMVKISM